MSDGVNDSMRDLVEDYVLGVLDGTVRARFEARLAEDPSLAAEVAAVREALTSLAFSAPVTPAPALKERLMSRIAESASQQPGAESERTTAKVIPFPTESRTRKLPVMLVAALAASLVLVVKFANDSRTARAEAAASANALAESDRLVAQRDSLIATLTNPAMDVITLAATGAAKPALKAWIDKGHRTVLISASSLQAVPDGQVYQFWFIIDGKPVPSVTFRPDADGRALVQGVAMPAGNVVATAITLEPAGGSAAPTSEVLFVGKVSTEK